MAEAEELVTSRTNTPELADADRSFLHRTLLTSAATIHDSGASEQLLHGEPHPGNVLTTRRGPLFVDLETCCRGPVEFDVAHVPDEVSDYYVDIDLDLLRECRHLVLAMVTAWRWDAEDQFPNGKSWGRQLLRVLRNGPPWPTLGRLAGDRTCQSDDTTASTLSFEGICHCCVPIESKRTTPSRSTTKRAGRCPRLIIVLTTS